MYGIEVPASPYHRGHVIGSIETAPAGNVILRCGELNDGGRSWSQTLHVATTPAEARLLAVELLNAAEVTSSELRRLADEMDNAKRATLDTATLDTGDNETLCPACEAVGSIRYTESVHEWRWVDPPTEPGGPVVVSGTSESSLDDEGSDAHLYCRHCLAEFVVDEIDWS